MRISASYPRGFGFGFGYLSHIQIRADLDVDSKVVSADEDMSQSSAIPRRNYDLIEKPCLSVSSSLLTSTYSSYFVNLWPFRVFLYVV